MGNSLAVFWTRLALLQSLGLKRKIRHYLRKMELGVFFNEIEVTM